MLKKLSLCTLAVVVLGCSCPDKAAEKKDAGTTTVTKDSLKTMQDKLNYSVGYDVGKSLTRNGLEFNDTIFMKGIVDGMNETAPALMDEQARMDIKREHSMEKRKKEQEERDAQAKVNKEAADKFLAENKGKEGVVTTDSGLQYIVLTEGKGPKPAAEDRVSVHYRGTLIDGTEFDSSYSRNQPATFPVNRVVKGWTEALQLMPTGSKWKLFLSPELGYGERGAGGKIGPNAALIFEVELIEILKSDATPAANPAARIDAMTKIKPAGTKPAAAPAQ